MSRRRQVRLLRTVTVAYATWWALPRAWSWWAGLDSWERSSAALFVSAVVMLVWGIACCLREYRLEQLRAAMDRHPSGRRA